MYLQCDERVLLRRCAGKDRELTIMATVCRIVEGIARLPVISPGSGRSLAHLLLVVTLKLIHGSGVAQTLRDDREARLLEQCGRKVWVCMDRYRQEFRATPNNRQEICCGGV